MVFADLVPQGPDVAPKEPRAQRSGTRAVDSPTSFPRERSKRHRREEKNGAPGRIRTSNRRIRSPKLYPVELRVRDWSVIVRRGNRCFKGGRRWLLLALFRLRCCACAASLAARAVQGAAGVEGLCPACFAARFFWPMSFRCLGIRRKRRTTLSARTRVPLASQRGGGRWCMLQPKAALAARAVPFPACFVRGSLSRLLRARYRAQAVWGVFVPLAARAVPFPACCARGSPFFSYLGKATALPASTLRMLPVDFEAASVDSQYTASAMSSGKTLRFSKLRWR